MEEYEGIKKEIENENRITEQKQKEAWKTRLQKT